MPESEIYISDVCGASWWGALHGVVGAINCTSCRDHGAQLMSGMHDLINHALGKPIYDPKNFNDVANYYHSALQELIAQQEQHSMLGQGECPTEFGFSDAVLGAISDHPNKAKSGFSAILDDALVDALFDSWPMSSQMLQLSRFRCMTCQEPPEIEVLWAEGRARAWFCGDCFEDWKIENGDDIVSTESIEGEARSTNRSRRAGMGQSDRQDFAQELEDAAELELSAMADFALPAFDEVTKKICEAMERGTVPWRRPWSTIAAARNAITNRPYSGINPFLLALSDFTDPRWMTFKQAKKLGGNVKQGSKGTTIIFWKLLRKNVGVSPGTTTDEDDETPISKVVPLLRHYTVFNFEQTEGTKLPAFVPEAVNKVEAIDAAEAVIQGYPNPPKINHEGGDRAFYRPSTDTVSLPPRGAFNDSAAFYETAFHELGHSTGHETRLNRRDEEPAPFGSPVYAREELVAEFCAAFLMQDVGLDSVIENAAAYIEGWTRAIQDEPKMIVIAATRGEKAALHILGPQAIEDVDEDEMENRFGASVPVLELADLADPPGLAIVKKFGRTYTFTRTFSDGETAPEVTTGLNKAEALKMFDDTVRADQGFDLLDRNPETILAREIFTPAQLQDIGLGEEDDQLADELDQVLAGLGFEHAHP